MNAGAFADFAPLLAAVALIWKIVDFAKHVRVRDVDAVVTQTVTWGAGVLIVWLLAQTDFAGGVQIGGMTLAHLNLASLVLLGLSGGSSASVAYDYKRSIDHSDSAAQPSLVTGRVPVTPPPTVASSGVTFTSGGAPANWGGVTPQFVEGDPDDA